MIRKIRVHVEADIVDGKTSTTARFELANDSMIEKTALPGEVARLLETELGAWMQSSGAESRVKELTAELERTKRMLEEIRTANTPKPVVVQPPAPVVVTGTVHGDHQARQQKSKRRE